MTEALPQVQLYKFERREALDRGRLRRLTPILEVMAHRISGSLTSTLRTPVRVSVGEMDQQPWEHYANELPEPTFLASVAITPLGGRVVLHLPLRLSMALVEVRLGGARGTASPDRALTEIEQRLVSEVAQGALRELPPSFAPVISLGLGAISLLASAMFLQAINPTEGCLLLGLHLYLGDDGPYDASICMPLSLLLPILDALERLDRVEPGEEEDLAGRDLRARLLEMPCDLTVCFPDVKLSPAELLSLTPGDVIRLDRPEGLPLLLSLKGVYVGKVVPTQRGRRLACMVVESEAEEEGL